MENMPHDMSDSDYFEPESYFDTLDDIEDRVDRDLSREINSSIVNYLYFMFLDEDNKRLDNYFLNKYYTENVVIRSMRLFKVIQEDTLNFARTIATIPSDLVRPHEIYVAILLLRAPLWMLSDRTVLKVAYRLIQLNISPNIEMHVLALFEQFDFKHLGHYVKLMKYIIDQAFNIKRSHKREKVIAVYLKFTSLIYASNVQISRISPNAFQIRALSKLPPLTQLMRLLRMGQGPLPSDKVVALAFPYLIPFEYKLTLTRTEFQYLQDLNILHTLEIINNRYFQAPFNIPKNICFTIKREQLVNSTISEINNHYSLRRDIRIIFDGENGADEGGLFREWLENVIAAIVDDDRLFQYNAQAGTYFPMASATDKGCLEVFYLFGLMMGFAYYNSFELIGIDLPEQFFMKLFGENFRIRKPSITDLICIDPIAGKNLENLSSLDVDEAFDILGYKKGDLKRDKTNLEDVIRKSLEEYLNTNMAGQFYKIFQGFCDISISNSLTFFTPIEFRSIFCGITLQGKGLQMMRNRTKYRHCNANNPIIKWFWEIVEEMDEKYQTKLLKFITGSKRLPTHRSPPITLAVQNLSNASSDLNPNSFKLPTAHTCNRELILDAAMDSKDIFKTKLYKAIDLGGEGFGFI
ncbi:hypothetical protein ACOME3_009972 [Neoechinorhynchus agilis]